MRIDPSVVRTCQKRFFPHILTALILICVIIWQLIESNTGNVNTDRQLTSQDGPSLVSSHTGNSAHTSHTKPELTPSAIATTAPQTSQNIPPPSGQIIPIGNVTGWRQIFVEDFNIPIPLGGFPGSIYRSKFTVYPDGSPDTAGQQGGPSRYYPSKVVSVSNGLLNLYLHTENGTPMAAAILPILPGKQLYGKYVIRFRSDALQGFKVAWLLWPDSEYWPHDGEMDFPESPLNSTIAAFMHREGATSGSDQDTYKSTATYTSWHTATIEWSPNAVNFILDDQSIGASTARIPNTSMHWVIQTESCLPTCPSATTAGNLQIDWIAAYAPA
jgi:Glycosyl hydrolases family 16